MIRSITTDERMHGEVFEREYEGLNLVPLQPGYDAWTQLCLDMMQGYGFKVAGQYDLEVRDKSTPAAPPSRAFKIEGCELFCILNVYPVTEQALLVKEGHHDSISFDDLLVYMLAKEHGQVQLVTKSDGSSVIKLGDTSLYDNRTLESKRLLAEEKRRQWQKE